MKLNDVFPSKYLKADDLQGREHEVTIREIKFEKMDEGMKPVIYFAGKERGLMCNKTNAKRIAMFHGDDTDGWVGKKVTLYRELVDFQGEPTWAIRVKGPAGLTNPENAEFSENPGF